VRRYLATEIIDGELIAQRTGDGGPASTERDFSFAMELLTGVRRWLNDQDIAEVVREERAKGGAA
jgi:hypothetical protein